MRVGIISIQHESNSFLATPTTLDDFKAGIWAVGEDVRRAFSGTHHEVNGFFEGLDRDGIEAVPILAAVATPLGTVQSSALDSMLSTVMDGLDRAGELDGLLVAPHGAGVSEREPDMDGYWLQQVRERVGPDMPMICTLDAHANLSERMVSACDATIIYRSNPHLDQRQRGHEAAALMARTLRGEVRPTQAAALPPIAINIERQFTEAAPCKPMYDLADELLRRPGVLSNSVALGFPYADVPEMGSGFVVVTNDDPDLAQQCADELAGYLHGHREEFQGDLVGVDEAIDQALAADGPVCLLDMGDNAGGGSAADGTFILKRLHEREQGAAFIAIYDPDSAAAAIERGVGSTLTLTMGGKTDDQHGPPVTAEVSVEHISDGEFSDPRPRHGGRVRYSMGPTALVNTVHGISIQLTSLRAVPLSLEQVRASGLDPADFKILVAKGVIAPMAAYREVCDTMIRVNTGGSTSADMAYFDYEHRRRPLFPFEEIG